MNTALISTFLWTLIVFYCPDPVWTTRAEDTALLGVEDKMMLTDVIDMVRSMKADMEATVAEMKTKDERISSLENSMAILKVELETKDERIDSLEGSVAILKDSVAIMKVEMEAKDERMAVLENKMTDKEEEMTSLRGRMAETEETDLQLREMVDQVRNPPFAFQCAWHLMSWASPNSTITYDRLTYDDISGGGMDAAGGMDISTGVFTVGQGFSGVWSITFSISSYPEDGQFNEVFLFLNGQFIEESFHYTYNSNPGPVTSLGSRTLYMRLEEGDQVTLRTVDVSSLSYISICFELAQFDYNP